MKEKIARRSLLKTLGTAAAAGTAACGPKARFQPPASVPPGSLPRVNLICHGMMLLWQDITKIHNGDTSSGITIYAPDVMGMHLVSLTTQIGGDGNLLSGPGSYTLAFTCKNTTPLGPRDPTKNLVIYDTFPHSKGLAVNAGNAQYVLQVPYPTSIRSYRTMKFPKAPPYRVDIIHDTTRTFNIHPSQLMGLNVLTYDNVSSPITLAKGTGSPQTIGTNPVVLNLHFYATTKPGVVPSSSHLSFFDALLQYNGHSTLDLEVDPMNPVHTTPPAQEQVDGDLSQLDVYDLVELKPGGRASDPVGCIEGWGS